MILEGMVGRLKKNSGQRSKHTLLNKPNTTTPHMHPGCATILPNITKAPRIHTRIHQNGKFNIIHMLSIYTLHANTYLVQLHSGIYQAQCSSSSEC